MGEVTKVGDLEVDQDLGHARVTWRVQRVGWIVMLLLIAAGLAGFFGRGPLATAEMSTSGLRVDYERFGRHGAVMSLALHLEPATFTENEARVWLDREFLEGHELQGVTPEPERVTAGSDSVWFTFAVSDPAHPMRVRLDLRPDAMWLRRGRAGTPNGSTVGFSQFIYP